MRLTGSYKDNPVLTTIVYILLGLFLGFGAGSML